jgi:serine protease Do
MDSPAMDAGLQSGDVIQSVNGQEVMNVAVFSSTLLLLEPKETYSVEVMREGTNGYQKITCKVKMGILK